MKKLALLFTTVFLVGTSVSATTSTFLTRGYGNSFIFTEGGIEFSVFPDGQFDFYMPNYGPNVNVAVSTPNVSISFNSGYDYNPYVQYDDFGAIIQIENIPIYYDYYGRITRAGNVNIHYTNFGRVSRIGNLYIHYNTYNVYTHYTGFINVYNRYYVYRPWHSYYVIPVSSFCIVHPRPYRQYYQPVRYTYYRPYVNNYRQPVNIGGRRESTINNGRRGNTATASTTRISDRYRQEPVLSSAETTRRTNASTQNDVTRATGTRRTTDNVTAANNGRSSTLNSTTRSSGNSVDRNTTRTNTNNSSISTQNNNTRSVTGTNNSVSNNRAVVNKNNTEKKPSATANRITSSTSSQNSKSVTQSSNRSSSNNRATQNSSGTTARRGNL